MAAKFAEVESDWNRQMAVDKNRMIDRIMGFPEDIAAAVKIADSVPIPDVYRTSRLVLLTGMGGSGIPADFVKSLYGGSCRVCIYANKDYGVPSFVDTDSLVLAVSYSGTTQETIDAYLAALRRGAHVVGVTSGDRLLQLCRENGTPHFLAPAGRTTRESFAYLLFGIIRVMQRLDFIAPQDEAIEETANVCTELAKECAPSRPSETNLAKRLSLALYERLPVVYGSYTRSASAALRWKQQLNENSKAFAVHETFPDFTHNELVVYEDPRELGRSITAIFLRDQDEPAPLQARISEAQKLVRRGGAEIIDVYPQGKTLPARLVYLSYLGDFVSYYLALLRGVDPTPTPFMSRLKDALGLTDLTPGRDEFPP